MAANTDVVRFLGLSCFFKIFKDPSWSRFIRGLPEMDNSLTKLPWVEGRVTDDFATLSR